MTSVQVGPCQLLKNVKGKPPVVHKVLPEETECLCLAREHAWADRDEWKGGCSCGDPHHTCLWPLPAFCLRDVVTCLLPSFSRDPCLLWLVDANQNKNGELEGSDLISSVSWSGYRGVFYLFFFFSFFPEGCDPHSLTSKTVCHWQRHPTSPPSISFLSAWHQDSPFISGFNSIF